MRSHRSRRARPRSARSAPRWRQHGDGGDGRGSSELPDGPSGGGSGASGTGPLGPIARDRPSRSRTPWTGGPRSDGRSSDFRAPPTKPGSPGAPVSYWPSLPRCSCIQCLTPPGAGKVMAVVPDHRCGAVPDSHRGSLLSHDPCRRVFDKHALRGRGPSAVPEVTPARKRVGTAGCMTREPLSPMAAAIGTDGKVDGEGPSPRGLLQSTPDQPPSWLSWAAIRPRSVPPLRVWGPAICYGSGPIRVSSRTASPAG